MLEAKVRPPLVCAHTGAFPREPQRLTLEVVDARLHLLVRLSLKLGAAGLGLVLGVGVIVRHYKAG